MAELGDDEHAAPLDHDDELVPDLAFPDEHRAGRLLEFRRELRDETQLLFRKPFEERNRCEVFVETVVAMHASPYGLTPKREDDHGHLPPHRHAGRSKMHTWGAAAIWPTEMLGGAGHAPSREMTGTNRSMADGCFRVATFNIRHGAPPGGRVDHGALAQTCAQLDAHVIGLQEVDSGRLRSLFRNQAAFVARRLGCAFVYGEVLRRGMFGRYGNALLTRGALRDVELVQLPRPSPRQARGAILARVELAGLDVSVAATHLQHHPAELGDQPREAAVQLRALLDTLNQRPLPRLLLGDLNLGPRRAKPLLAAAGFDCAPDVPTFPAEGPRVTLDYIAVRGLHILESAAVPTEASDHRAVVATVAVEPIE